MRRYLVQDYQFIDGFVALLGAAIASADRYQSRIRLAQFAAMITSEENTYFVRAFDALNVTQKDREVPDLTETTRRFQSLMADAVRTARYPMCLSVLAVAEWLYQSWAARPDPVRALNFIHAEWITLHNNAYFNDFVAWLRGELDRLGPTLDLDERERCAAFFVEAVTLERRFFDQVYALA